VQRGLWCCAGDDNVFVPFLLQRHVKPENVFYTNLNLLYRLRHDYHRPMAVSRSEKYFSLFKQNLLNFITGNSKNVAHSFCNTQVFKHQMFFKFKCSNVLAFEAKPYFTLQRSGGMPEQTHTRRLLDSQLATAHTLYLKLRFLLLAFKQLAQHRVAPPPCVSIETNTATQPSIGFVGGVNFLFAKHSAQNKKESKCTTFAKLQCPFSNLNSQT